MTAPGWPAQALAQEDGVSLDQFVATALAQKVAVLDADSYIRARADRGDREKLERVLAKVPDVEIFRPQFRWPPRGQCPMLEEA